MAIESSNNYRSEEVNLLYGALAKSQGSYGKLVENVNAPGGVYANLSAVIDATRPALSANELSFNFYEELLDSGSGASLIWTTLGHSSGQYIQSCARVVRLETFRETFNSIESYKRLSACNLLGIAPSANDPLIRDDNGIDEYDKKIVKSLRNNDNKVKSEYAVTITKEQYDDICFELEGYEQIAKGIQEFFNVKTIADIPADQIYFVRDKIRKLKKTHDDYVSNK